MPRSLRAQMPGEHGMLLLFAVAWPPQGISVKKPINSTADLKGFQWRAHRPPTARIAESVGAQPVTMRAAELSQAMATGVVESAMSSGSTVFDTKTFEHLKFFTDTQAVLIKAGTEAEAHGWATSNTKSAINNSPISSTC